MSIYISRETIILLFYLAFWIFFVLSHYISAHFIEPLVSGNVLEIVMPITNWISKHCTFKGMTSKVTAQDGSVYCGSEHSRYQKFFSNLLNWCETLCSVTGVSGQGIILVLVIPVNRVILIAGSSQSPLPSQSPQVSQSFHSSYVSQSQRHSPYPTHPSHPSHQSHHCNARDPGHPSHPSHLSHPSNHSHPCHPH